MSAPTTPLKQTSDNLVVTRAGPLSLHPKWLTGAKPEFDLVVTAYAPNAPVADGEQRIAIEGRKVAGYGRFFREHADVLDRYAVIALIDDDIDTDAFAINECFRLGPQYGLRIWQPGLTFDSYFTHGITLRNPLFNYRTTDYVEMMCPFFEAGALRLALELFYKEAETGIDLVWSRHPTLSSQPCGIVDRVKVKHSRPVGSMKHLQGFDAPEGYTPQIEDLLAQYDMELDHPLTTGGSLRFLNTRTSSFVTNILQFHMAASLFYGRYRTKYVARAFYHHFRRVLLYYRN